MSPKVLMLHGLFGNAEWFEAKTRSVRAAVASSGVEFVFVDAPHIKQYPTVRPSGFSLPAGPSSVRDSPSSAVERPRGWYFGEADDFIHGQNHGVTESLTLLRQVLEEKGPFDGVWGFSMGASMAILLCLLVEDPNRHPIFARPGVEGKNWPPQKFKFAMLSSGFLCQDQDPLIRQVLKHKVQTPALLLFGAADYLVPDYGFSDLANTFADKRVEWFEGGHFLPTKPRWVKFMSDYLAHPTQRDALPSPAGARYSRIIAPPPLAEADEVAVEAAHAVDGLPPTVAPPEPVAVGLPSQEKPTAKEEEKERRAMERSETEKKLTESKAEGGWAKRTFSRVRRSAMRLSWSGDKRQSFVVQATFH